MNNWQVKPLILFLLCLVLLTGGLLLNRLPEAEESETEETISLYDYNGHPLLTARVENPEGGFSLTLVNGLYQIESVPRNELNLEYLEMLLRDLTKLEAIERISDPALEKFGLDQPSILVYAQYEGLENPLRLRVGRQETVSGGFYVQREGDKAIYLVDARKLARFRMSTERFVQFILIPPQKTRSPLQALKMLEIEKGTEHLKIVRPDPENPDLYNYAGIFGTPAHLLVAPNVYKANDSKLLSLADSLFGLIAERVVAVSASDEELELYGLLNPALNLTLLRDDLETEKSIRLSFSFSNGKIYGRMDDGRSIYELPSRLDLQMITAAQLTAPQLPGPLLLDTEEVILRTKVNHFSYRLSFDEQKKLTVMADGQEIDSVLFRKFYNLIAFGSGNPEKTAPEIKTGHSDADLVLVFRIREQAKPVELRFYRYNALSYYAYLGDQGLFEVPSSFVERIREANEQVILGKDFNSAW